MTSQIYSHIFQKTIMSPHDYCIFQSSSQRNKQCYEEGVQTPAFCFTSGPLSRTQGFIDTSHSCLDVNNPADAEQTPLMSRHKNTDPSGLTNRSAIQCCSALNFCLVQHLFLQHWRSAAYGHCGRGGDPHSITDL